MFQPNKNGEVYFLLSSFFFYKKKDVLEGMYFLLKLGKTFFYLKIKNIYYLLFYVYRKSPDSTNSISTIPGLVRIANRTILP